MSELETVHNHYERKVFEEINDNYIDKGLSDTQLADLACIALNRIPPRYIRHDIDMSFYMSSEEYNEIESRVSVAVKMAYKKLKDSDNLKEDHQ
jgi:hypothetical protein